MNRTAFPRRISMAWLQAQYRAGNLTPEEAVDEIILRAQEHKAMNIWIIPPSESFCKPYLERLKNLDPQTHPLWGIPFAIKDTMDLAGVPTTVGCPAFSFTPQKNAIIIDRLLEAGAVPVGKTNLDQFGTGLVGVRSPYGEVHNSMREEMISGGSSSGSGVALAMGMCAFALGSDTAGSGRVPAALNNLVGYKPSVGAWPMEGSALACASIDCDSVFTLNIEEALELNQIMRGYCADDYRSKEIPYVHDQVPKKILIPDKLPTFYGDYAEQYKQAWLRSIEKIKQLGVPVEAIDTTLFEKAALILYDGCYIAERWAAHGEFVTQHADDIFPVTRQILQAGSGDHYSAADLFKTLDQLTRYRVQTQHLMKDAVLVLPTCGGTFTRAQVDADPIRTNSQMGLYTNHCNLLLLGAVALPSGWAEDQLPFGITVFALGDNEGMLGAFGTRYAKLWEETMDFAVCGLHKKGFPLEYQMQEAGATYIRSDKTAPFYKLVRLTEGNEKPGLIRGQSGSSIDVDIWRMPVSAVGSFLSHIDSPQALGAVSLADGSTVHGFICEGYALATQEDITAQGWQ